MSLSSILMMLATLHPVSAGAQQLVPPGRPAGGGTGSVGMFAAELTNTPGLPNAPGIPDAPGLPDAAGLPDAPGSPASPAGISGSSQQSPVSSSAETTSDTYGGKQTKRILGIVPNFRSVSASSHPPPETAGEKFKGFLQDSFDYSSFVYVGGVAGLNQLANTTPEFHQGLKGYARYYWHSYVDQTDENLWVGYLLPAALHQDPRYFTLGHGGALKRTFYSFSRIVVTRTDSGRSAFNFSEVAGSGAAAGISNLYYPSKERTFGNTGRQWGQNVALDGLTFIFKEFWPDLNRAVFHQKN